MKKLHITIYLLFVTMISFAQVAAPNFVTKEEYKQEKRQAENPIIYQSSISAPPFLVLSTI